MAFTTIHKVIIPAILGFIYNNPEAVSFLFSVALIYVIHRYNQRTFTPNGNYVSECVSLELSNSNLEDRHEDSVLEWNHDNFKQVGGSSVLTINLVSNRGSPYTCKPSDHFHCGIWYIKGTALATRPTTVIPHVIEPSSLTGQSTIKVSFTAKISGAYSIRLIFNGQPIGGNIYRKYLPGPVDSNKTVFMDFSAVFLVTKGVYKLMKIIPKDSYGNEIDIDESSITVEIRKDSEDGTKVFHELVVSKEREWCELLIKLDKEGHYVACIKYLGQRIGPSNFTILSLSEQNMQIVEDNVKIKDKDNVYYEARDINRSKKVYCYMSSRQLQVREYALFFFRKRTRSYKISPSTKIIFHLEPQHFTVDDGFQEPLKLESRHREIIGATYHRFLCQNIGGSEKFQDKRDFFYSKLRGCHDTEHRTRKDVTVSRIYLLESAMEATKRFPSEDWYKKFNIKFEDEPGLDYGGVGREFFELICVNLFDASNRLFMQFSDENHQALVHPNYSSKRPPNLTLEHFNFAGKIVGKCLYESAMGNTLLVKARFTRSFLAQLIGLRINYMYFESDDPDLYTTKIQYILDQDISEEDLGLVFAEEEFDSRNGHKVVPLIANGERIEVTERNKRQYLNELARYRFTRRVSEEIQEFLNGLNEIIPDNLGLLSTFNEHELELLMCGIDQVSYEDLKEHANVSGSSLVFQRVLAWFWTTVSAFTQEEMAKLLQFVTGSSQLPPGGFAELDPRFTITSAPTTGRLPTAHTCFNRLCLPEYSSCEQFQTSLMIALNEGTEGFGME